MKNQPILESVQLYLDNKKKININISEIESVRESLEFIESLCPEFMEKDIDCDADIAFAKLISFKVRGSVFIDTLRKCLDDLFSENARLSIYCDKFEKAAASVYQAEQDK